MSLPLDAMAASLRADGDRLAAMAGGDLGAPVVSCPGWTVLDLLVHVGRVHRWAAVAVATPPDGDRPPFAPRPAAGADLAEWLADGVGALLTVFGGTELHRPCWGFAGDADGRWWLRRQAIETALHRWDAEGALGSRGVLDAELAAVGVDEWCELQTAFGLRASAGDALTVHLHATDGDGEWLITLDEAGLKWQHGHHKGDVAIRASRSELLLMLWNRLPTTSLDCFGDSGPLSDLLARSAR